MMLAVAVGVTHHTQNSALVIFALDNSIHALHRMESDDSTVLDMKVVGVVLEGDGAPGVEVFRNPDCGNEPVSTCPTQQLLAVPTHVETFYRVTHQKFRLPQQHTSVPMGTYTRIRVKVRGVEDAGYNVRYTKSGTATAFNSNSPSLVYPLHPPLEVKGGESLLLSVAFVEAGTTPHIHWELRKRTARCKEARRRVENSPTQAEEKFLNKQRSGVKAAWQSMMRRWRHRFIGTGMGDVERSVRALQAENAEWVAAQVLTQGDAEIVEL